MDFEDFELDPFDLAFALGISEEMADEEMERLSIIKDLNKDDDIDRENDPY